MNTLQQSISWLSLTWCVLPVCFICGIYLAWNMAWRELLYANLRMAIQLIIIGYVLLIIFNRPSLWISLAILLMMVVVASWIAIRPVRQCKAFYLPALSALAIAVGVHLFISLVLVLDVEYWYEPRVLVPLAGMYFANAMNTVSLAAERYLADLKDKKDEAQARVNAFQAAMIPQINGLLAVGLVALPGMMTGQILSGVSPLIAVRYQILIMTMVLGAGALSSALMLWQLRHRDDLV